MTCAASVIQLFALAGVFRCAALKTSEVVSAKDSAATQPLKILKLQRTSVTLPETAERPGKPKNFYSAELTVGNPPKEFLMAFDLGGGTTILPSKDCNDPACLERRRYNKWESDTAEDINANGQLVEAKVHKTLLRRRDRGSLGLHAIDVGSGNVKGVFVRDQICVRSGDGGFEDKDPRCFPLGLLAATSMSDLPFLLEPYDGAVGLGLNGMSINPQFNFLSSFRQGYGSALPINSFGLHIGTDDADGGEITFGGYDMKRLTHPLKWAKVVNSSQDGRWQVSISAIRIGDQTLHECRDHGCIAAIDYSSSLLSAPTNLVDHLEKSLEELALPNGFGNGCHHTAIPDIYLELSDDLTLTLPAEDFVSGFGGSKTTLSSNKVGQCRPHLVREHDEGTVQLGPSVFILGEATLRRYYTFFDADSLQVGFSLAAPQLEAKKLLSNPSQVEEKDKTKKGETIVVLFQVNLRRSKTIGL